MTAKRKRKPASTADGTAKPRGRPFPKGNPGAWKPGQSGNPKGGAILRPLIDETRRFYEEDPTRLRDLVVTLHKGAVGRGKLKLVQVAAYRELARKVDREHLKEDGTDRPVLEGISLELDVSRGPERAPILLNKNAPNTDGAEIEFPDGQPAP